MNRVGTAYVLWLGGLFGIAGLHRLYNGKIWTGLLWLFSGGLFGVGQLADLLFIPHCSWLRPTIKNWLVVLRFCR